MRYLSLELEENVPQSIKSDVWSFGVAMLELAYKDSEIIVMNHKKIEKEFELKGSYSNNKAEFLVKCLKL